MNEILLIACNARYNHTNLAVRSINAYVKKHEPSLDKDMLAFKEWTIHNHIQDILRDTYEKNPHIIIFSVYIWNVSLIFDIIRELRKILPNTVIAAGGPEVSYKSNELFAEFPEIDCILQGEGEQTVSELVQLYQNLKKDDGINRAEFLNRAGTVPGVFARNTDGQICFGGQRSVLCDMSQLAFAYPVITEADSRLFYYETSRGCPFSCSYCLSSIDKTMRFMPTERVFEDIRRFMDANVKIVKFVDRTFNIDKDRCLAIWQYICDNHNGITMFHFEIGAQYLDRRLLDFLQNVQPGIMQFEIGIQSINEQTLMQIHRPNDLKKLKENIQLIPKTIHTHLDIIAGLPKENLHSFEKSFNYTMALKPDMLQLGFLKILSGTEMESYAKTNDYVWQSKPPYEVLQTPVMSYADICFLHDISDITEKYYNSGYFSTTMNFLLDTHDNAFYVFKSLAEYFRNRHLFDNLHKSIDLFEYLNDFLRDFLADHYVVAYELLRFDYLLIKKTSTFPQWFIRHYDKNEHHKALIEHTNMHSTREAYAQSAFEIFSVHPLGNTKEPTGILFLYNKTKDIKTEIKTIEII